MGSHSFSKLNSTSQRVATLFVVLSIVSVLSETLSLREQEVEWLKRGGIPTTWLHSGDVQSREDALVQRYQNAVREEITKGGSWESVFIGDALRTKTQGRGVEDTFYSQYYDYEQLTTLLQNYSATYPQITRLFSIGQTTEGREMWVMRITEDPDEDNWSKRQFKYVGNMHGDETVGRQLLIYFIDWLLTSGEERASALIENTDIHILVSMNPDGFEQGSRTNARGKDLNRNFPDQFTDNTTSLQGREVEVQNVMRWTAQNHFILTANFHGGALVANYPFDSTASGASRYSTSPDDALFQDLARLYSYAHTTMRSSKVFRDGITNGAAWYALSGGMQDWNYLYEDCFGLTLEVSDVKYPPAEELPSYWEANKAAMIAYVERVHGPQIYGVVTSDKTGEGLEGVLVTISGSTKPIRTGPGGWFFRLVRAGSYTVTFSGSDLVTKKYPSSIRVTTGPQRADISLASNVQSTPSSTGNYVGNPPNCYGCNGKDKDMYGGLFVIGVMCFILILLVLPFACVMGLFFRPKRSG